MHQYFNIDEYNQTFQPTWKPLKVLEKKPQIAQFEKKTDSQI
jgi:hypothetical protein